MINPNFYIKDNLVSRFSFTSLRHYPKKSLSLSIEYSYHEVVQGEDLYSIAKIYFGNFGERYWTTIADLNMLIRPGNLTTGQIIKIPKNLVEPKVSYRVIYEKNVSTAIKI